MALKFRLRGLAETFLDKICCSECGSAGEDDTGFTTELTRVTLEGIIIVAECHQCGAIFVPKTQRLGILNPSQLKKAVEKDSRETGEPLYSNFHSVVLNAEKLNAVRKGEVH